jgi:hypothetical protein
MIKIGDSGALLRLVMIVDDVSVCAQTTGTNATNIIPNLEHETQ